MLHVTTCQPIIAAYALHQIAVAAKTAHTALPVVIG